MKILLICPHMLDVFSKSKIGIAVPNIPHLSLAMVASQVYTEGHEIRLLDLTFSSNPRKELLYELENFNPDYVGITCTTPLFNEITKISKIVKDYRKDIIVIAGGAHPSALPEETLRDSELDVVVIGEGDFTLLDIINKRLEKVDGIAFKKDGKIIRTKNRKLIENLDMLPLPAWEIFDIKRYKSPRLSARKSPVGPLETSRGCIFSCTYCNKSIFKQKFRTKSTERVLKDIEHNLNSGFKEIHIYDDCFSTDLSRAKKICDEIIRKRLKFPWNLTNGIRVDRVDKELFEKMKKAGCYRVSFGIESGSQKILDGIKKGITIRQIRKALSMAKEAGIETVGFFMLALPGDSKETIEQTIKFAKELKPDIPKIGITIPFPGTPLFNKWQEEGVIKSKEWRNYNYHNPSRIYEHPNLDWDTINYYYKKFYRELYLNPDFITRRFIRDVKNGELFYDMFYFLKTLKYGW